MSLSPSLPSGGSTAAPTPLTLSPTPTISPENPSLASSSKPTRPRTTSKPQDFPSIPEPFHYSGQGTPSSPFIVDFLPNDPSNPYNWSKPRKWFLTGLIAIATLCIAFASSSYSAAVLELVHKYGGSEEIGILGISLYVLGFGVGPLIWAPLSEIYGRITAWYLSFPLFAIFNLVGAVSQNWETVLVSRFLAGTFGASPLTNSGAQIADMWAAHERALATLFFALAPFLGPVLGPITGGFVAESKGYRWVFWMQFFFALVILIVNSIFVPETYAPTLLRKKAAQLQKESARAGKNEIFVSKFDLNRKSNKEIILTALSRPFQLLFGEPIVFCLSLYVAIIYATLYAFFTAFPIVFQEYRGWSQGIGGLAFLGIGVGLLLGVALSPFSKKRYDRLLSTLAPGESAPPEWRLTGALIGSILLPIGLFWFAWTCTPNVHWIVPIIASVPFGTGFLMIFTSVNLYLIDSYALYAASALAANAVMRSILATAFPLFTSQMYHNLGLHWAGTLVAFLSLACTPMPFLFYKYGPYLRRKSKYAPAPPPSPKEDIETAITNQAEINPEKLPQPRPEVALEPEYGPTAGEDATVTEKRA